MEICIVLVSLICTYISSGIINLKQVKREKGIVKKAIAAFPRKKNSVIYCIVMLIYMIVLPIVITNFYSENLCDYAKIVCTASLMWPMAQIDYKYFRIPNKLILLGVVYRLIIFIIEIIFFRSGLLSTLLTEIIGCVGIAVIILLCMVIVKGGIGMGDLKFFMLMGIMLGAYRLLACLFVIMVIAFVVALYKLIIKKEKKDAEFAFGPIIAVGSLISFMCFGV